MRLSAHEWDEQDILGRQDILARLQCGEENKEASVEERRRPMRPPILMVPMDTSDLVSIVQNWEDDNRTSKNFTHETTFSSLQDTCIAQNEPKMNKTYDDSSSSSISNSSGRLSHRLMALVRTTRDKWGKRKRRRAHSSQDTTQESAELGGYDQPESRFYKDIEPTLAMKCDVCVLSTYKNLFLFMDVLLQTGIWSCTEGNTTNHQDTSSSNNSIPSTSSESCDCIISRDESKE